MAIEEKTLRNGVVVGFDTDTNSYCNLPDGTGKAKKPAGAGTGAVKPDGGRKRRPKEVS